MAITGASAGIGRATALAFAGAGARLVLSARRREVLEAVAAECRAAGAPAADAVPGDVAHPADAAALVDAAVTRHGRLDVCLANAGFGIFGPFDGTSPADLERIVAVNLTGTLLLARAALPVWRRQGRGHLIAVSSGAGLIGIGGMAAYCATKFAQVGFVQGLRAELRGTGIEVSVVCPMSTRTEFFDVARYGGDMPPVRPSWPAHTPERVAARILACARRPRPRVLLTRPLALAAAALTLWPRLADWLPLRIPRVAARLAEPRP